MPSKYVRIEPVDILRETDKALLVRYQGEEHWIPLSQIEEPEGCEVGDTSTSLVITRWIAEEKELDFEDD